MSQCSFTPDSTTAAPVPPDSLSKAEWVSTVFLLIFAFYVAVVSIAYWVLKGTHNLAMTNRLTAICGFSLLVKCTWPLFELLPACPSDKICDISLKFGTASFAVNRGSLYFVLWMRQHSVYNVLSITRFWVNWSKRASKVVYYGILIFSLLIVLFGAITTSYSTNGGCIPQENFFSLFVLGIVGFSVFQVALFLLLMLPLSEMYRKNTGIKKTCIRLCVCTAIAVIIDIIQVVVAIHAKNLMEQNFWTNPLAMSLINFDSMVNVIALLASFGDYKTRFWPFMSHTLPHAVETPRAIFERGRGGD